MSTLSQALDRSLTLRRRLGYSLDTTERNLRHFIAFAAREDAESLSTALFRRWPAAFGHAHRHTLGRPLGDGTALCPMAPRHGSAP